MDAAVGNTGAIESGVQLHEAAWGRGVTRAPGGALSDRRRLDDGSPRSSLAPLGLRSRVSGVERSGRRRFIPSGPSQKWQDWVAWNRKKSESAAAVTKAK
ncbi:hypothetical protein NDU88_005125 [Pleurodeles waltl]|uniref:Uncharacterized protein n=1 Tax=Pleurodeles waltl TaxID=8319 RepID=A0AAV7W779_PLEWA|nr:hypothetical protein NDU88_005125 [Pleurodeles waltl]